MAFPLLHASSDHLKKTNQISSKPYIDHNTNLMAPLHRSFILFVLISTIFPAMTLATDFIVGDDKGWRLKFDYQAWAKDKDFRVGDRLIFNYPVGAHNVHKVNGTGFQDCVIPPPSEALISGSDVIVLATPGRKWYICGVGKHCETGGMKLFITVKDQYSPVPSPSPSIAPSPFRTWPF